MEFTGTFQSIKIKQFFMLAQIFKLFNHGFQMEYTSGFFFFHLSLVSFSEREKKGN